MFIDPISDPAWDELLGWPACGSIFQSAAWLRVLQRAYGHRPACLLDRGGSLPALLPLAEVDKLATGRRGVSIPFADYCQTRGTPDQIERLQGDGLAEGQKRNWQYLEFRGPCLLRNATPATDFYAHTLDLSGSSENRLGRLDPSVRRALRKGKGSLNVEFTTTFESIKVFYRLHSLTRQRHGLPPQPFRFFSAIWEHLIARDFGFVALAVHDGQPIAANMYFHAPGNAEAVYKFGASDQRYQNLRPNNLLMWEAMTKCAARGAQFLHLGRTSLFNAGLRRFKLSFGAAEQTSQYFRYDYGQSAFVVAPDRAESWANRIFRLMPVTVLQLAGRILYPQLS
jgi:hypothetical protein